MSPKAEPTTTETGSRSTDPSTADVLVDVNTHNERRQRSVRVSHIAPYDLSVPFEGSVAEFLPLTLKKIPDGPKLEKKIDMHFKGESPEVVCSLAEDWGFERIAINPRTRIGRYNLVEQTGMIRTAFQLAWDWRRISKRNFPNCQELRLRTSGDHGR